MSPLLETRAVVKEFTVGSVFSRSSRIVHALSGVDLAVAQGEILAVVGESGCGKSTLARCLTGLMPPTSGSVLLDGEDTARILAREPGRFRRAVQIVFQDPYASLNPRRTVGATVMDGLRLHAICPRGERAERAAAILAQVGLSGDYLGRHPHELSGGQRQRVAIARALAVGPKVLICDEPVSALDVSVQAQVINLLRDIQDTLGVAYVFISHNLALVRHISHRIAVMYLGQIVEIGPTAGFRERLLHPYSSALFDAAPHLGRPRDAARPPALQGDVPSPLAPPSGCRFRTRCPIAQTRCAEEAPALRPVGGREVRCHFPLEL